ncbi:MAG TPA: 4Fe-4S dicluster domain-containing protein [Terriglobales bacterium]|nr:4Fe-4S dicluster domain-containing protein [Terriglobales bacterium]
MHRWGMVIDLAKCTGCQACVVACQAENNIPPSNPEQAKLGRSIHWMEILTFTEHEYPNVKIRFMPRPCMHCDNPPCTKVCPVKATYYSKEEGIVGQTDLRCIGCRYCTTACPYTLKSFNWYKPHWPEEMKNYLNPDVDVRPRGVVEKCTFCGHRLVKIREKAMLEGREFNPDEYIPACVQACPSGVLYFGDLADPNSQVSQLSKSVRAFRLMEELGTKPKVIYLSEEV